ncbi:uncharacterized protein LOC109725109 [Ananas comosus]|uniref:Uncharacterized protein LOC109725109 n=2 Tax=Ananas comosus TaxID=4615 RepID=A0A6P5GM72_ANACO|nr:uncharacterized protein LOC109725109 [Ananas comosus]CAD1817903.1 unnamed protein product [Ananas comosus var. bracteatus]CAD1818054.1 unnamed protein product [Ananas comosus var. bracteatus]
MATTEETAVPQDGSDLTFPAVNAARELNLGVPEDFPVDPISSGVATAKELKEETEARARAKAEAGATAAAKCDVGGTLTSVLMVTAVVVAAVGVAIFVTKKLKET